MRTTKSRFVALVAVLLAACGSKTALPVPERAPVDDAALPDAGFDAGPGIPVADECVELPMEEPPEFIDVTFVARIQSADVLFLVDVTGSMSDEIAQIRATLQEVLIPRMIDAIPDLQLAVADFADFPVTPFGAGGDRPFRLHQRTTTDHDRVRDAVGMLHEASGGDGPESQVEALYQTATGAGREGYVETATCPTGGVGYPCFRPRGTRIVLLFTDAEFHNGPSGSQPYTMRPPPATYEEAVAALNEIGARVLGLFSGGSSFQALADLRQIATDTGAVTPEGEPIVFDIGTRGEELDDGVISSISTLVDEVPIDIDIEVEDWPGDAVDATEFVAGARALRADPASGATQLADRFEEVVPGTTVTFRIDLKNERFPAAAEAQLYWLTAVLRGDGVTRLQETVVAIVIPSPRGETCEELVTIRER